MPGKTYKSGGNCRSYYMCSENRQSKEMCCPEGQRYIAYGMCIFDASCKAECTIQEKDATTPHPVSSERKDLYIANSLL
jgi:hypothetical protein